MSLAFPCMINYLTSDMHTSTFAKRLDLFNHNFMDYNINPMGSLKKGVNKPRYTPFRSPLVILQLVLA